MTTYSLKYLALCLKALGVSASSLLISSLLILDLDSQLSELC